MRSINLLRVVLDTDLDASDWKELILNFREVIKDQTKKEFSANVFEQLWGAIGAVFCHGKIKEQNLQKIK